jgi:hypothetical protein
MGNVMGKLKYILILIPLLGLYLHRPATALACSCPELFTPPCVSYWRAEVVFTGTLTQIERGRYQGLAHFNVEKTFKGPPSKEREVAFVTGSCAGAFDFLKTGEKYLIYAGARGRTNDGRLEMSPCDRSMPLSDAAYDLEHIDKVIEKRIQPSISGLLSGLTEEDLKSVKIFITGGQVKTELSIKMTRGVLLIKKDFFGQYSIDLPGAETYRVRVILPFQAKVYAGDLGVDTSNSQTTFEYNVTLAEGQCDYREIYLVRVD